MQCLPTDLPHFDGVDQLGDLLQWLFPHPDLASLSFTIAQQVAWYLPVNMQAKSHTDLCYR